MPETLESFVPITVITEVEQAINDPGYVVRCMILDAMKMFHLDRGVAPTEVWITPSMEMLLNRHISRLCMHHEDGRPYSEVRQMQKFFGLIPHWDAEDFRLA